jgi:hypothetical protein
MQGENKLSLLDIDFGLSIYGGTFLGSGGKLVKNLQPDEDFQEDCGRIGNTHCTNLFGGINCNAPMRQNSPYRINSSQQDLEASKVAP